MSITILTYVTCDRCSNLDIANAITGPHRNGKLARKFAVRRGWHMQKGMDLCPVCVKYTEWPVIHPVLEQLE